MLTVYHHNSRMERVIYHAEDPLDCLDFSMLFVFDKVMDAAPQEPSSRIGYSAGTAPG